MPIEFHCGCGKVLKAADEHAGKRAKCKTCGQMVTIPGNQATASPSRAPAAQPIKIVQTTQTPSSPAARKPSAQTVAVAPIAATVAPSSAPAPLAPLSAALLNDLAAASRVCPGCGNPLSAKAVLCVDCGYNLKTGKKLVHQSILPPDEEEQKPRRLSPVAKFFTDRIFNAKVWTGLGMMALAAIWFFGALWYGHRIFLYPPIMFILGAISFLSGLIDGANA